MDDTHQSRSVSNPLIREDACDVHYRLQVFFKGSLKHVLKFEIRLFGKHEKKPEKLAGEEKKTWQKKGGAQSTFNAIPSRSRTV